MIVFRDGENILAVYRRHKFILFLEAFPLALFSLVIVAAAFLGVGQLNEEAAIFSPLIFFILVLFLHLLWVALFVVLADFYLDVWILTNGRVIAVEQKGLFSRTISEFELAKVQDMTVDIHGILATLLNYGNLNVRTASEHQNFIFKQIWRPNAVKDEITKACLERAERTSQSHVPPF